MPVVLRNAHRPASASRDSRPRTPCSPNINSESPTFCLSGSQLNLTPRPSNHGGKASVRSVCVLSKKKRRPMSAVQLPSHQGLKKMLRKPRPMSADIEKYLMQRHSVEDGLSSEQPWKAFDANLSDRKSSMMAENISIWRENDNSPNITKSSLTSITMTVGSTVTPDKLENHTDALLDQLLESTVQQTKKQLRFAQTDTDLLKLNLPTNFINSDFLNPVEDFLGTLVDDIKEKVRDSFLPAEEERNSNFTLNDKPKSEDFESKKELVEQILINNHSTHPEEPEVISERNNHKKQKLRKPKTIAELLEIIDSEIPIQFRKKPTLPPKPKLKKSVIGEENNVVNNSTDNSTVMTVEHATLTPSNASEYHKDNQTLKPEVQQSDTKEPIKKKEGVNLDTIVDHSTKDKKLEDSVVPPSEKTQGHSLNDILSFLDQVEKSDDISAIASSEKHPVLRGAQEVMHGDSVERQVAALKDALEERTAHVQLLKESLLQARVEASDSVAASNRDHRGIQRKQKAEYETALKKMHDNMDKLLGDKKQLVEKVEELVQQLKSVESKHQNSLQAMQQRHTVEVARTKQLAAAAEKIRRERWVERQTARIKELTVKGLEPELTRLSLQHENKVAQLQAVHARELQAQAEAEARRADELRALLTRDKDEELARERALLTERFERQLCEERAMLELRCERLKEEAAAEVSRLQAGWAVQREAIEAQARQEAARMQANHDQHVAQLEEKKQADIAAAQEAMQSEQQAWLAAQSRKHAEVLAAKQQELREERDAEIERAIERLESEERRDRAEQEREVEKKLTRLREQHSAVLADRDLAERLLQARLSDAQTTMQSSEEQLLAAKAAESRLKQELCISMQRVEALEADHARVRDNVTQQFETRVTELEQHIESLKKERDAELEQVHARLKGVLEKKDLHIDQLRAQEAELSKRCRHLESLLGRKPLSSANL